MRILFLSLLFIGFVTYGQKKECNCDRVSTGNFYIPEARGVAGDTLFIHRTGSEQVEIVGDYYEKRNHVIWISPCRYVLRDVYNNTSKKYDPKDVIVQIIETSDDYYIAKAWAPKNKKTTFVVYIVK